MQLQEIDAMSTWMGNQSSFLTNMIASIYFQIVVKVFTLTISTLVLIQVSYIYIYMCVYYYECVYY